MRALGLSRTTGLRLLAALLGFAGAFSFASAPAADAAGAPVAGWWSRAATNTPTEEAPTALPLPAPSTPGTVPVGETVPEDQLLVEGTPEGATAIAAVHWLLDAGESSPSLTLSIAPGSTLTPESVILACRAAAPWEPPTGAGTWDTKPLTDPVACVNGIVADDVSSVSFGLQPLVSGSKLDVVLAPGTDPNAAPPPGVPEPPADVDGSVFRWLFDAPSTDALDIIPGDFVEGEGDRFVEPPPTTPEGFGATEVVPPSPTTTAPPVTSPPADTTPPPRPALDASDLAAAPSSAPAPVPAATAGAVGNRTVGFVFLVLAGLVAAWSYLAPSPETEASGLGRFARPRSAPPTPLS